MQGVEHLGQYVFEMTQAKIKSLQAGKEILDAAPVQPGTDVNAEEDDDEVGEDETEGDDEVDEKDIPEEFRDEQPAGGDVDLPDGEA